MFAHYALICLWHSNPDFTVTSIAKCLRDVDDYSGDMSGHLGTTLQNNFHLIFHHILDLVFFTAQTLRSNPSQDYRGADYAA
jgi:hypothetical protein